MVVVVLLSNFLQLYKFKTEASYLDKMKPLRRFSAIFKIQISLAVFNE